MMGHGLQKDGVHSALERNQSHDLPAHIDAIGVLEYEAPTRVSPSKPIRRHPKSTTSQDAALNDLTTREYAAGLVECRVKPQFRRHSCRFHGSTIQWLNDSGTI